MKKEKIDPKVAKAVLSAKRRVRLLEMKRVSRKATRDVKDTAEARQERRDKRELSVPFKNKGLTGAQLREIRGHEFNFWGEPRR